MSTETIIMKTYIYWHRKIVLILGSKKAGTEENVWYEIIYVELHIYISRHKTLPERKFAKILTLVNLCYSISDDS